MISTIRAGASAAGILAAVALAGSSAQAAPSPAESLAPLSVADPASVVDGSYIVVLDEQSTAATSSSAAAAAAAVGAEVEHVYRAIRGYAARMSDDELEAVRKDPAVAYVEADQTVSLSATQQNATWGLDRIDQRNLPLSTTYTYTPTGAGVDAYVIDTGIRTTHAEFSGRTAPGYTAINDGNGTNDCQGHGTHVAGTVGGTTYGVAKGATLIPVRVLGCDGSGSNAGVIAGVDWVAANRSGPSVANMSLGGGASTALDNAIAAATGSGVTFVVAAGNENQNACNVSPARAPSAITVGASTRSDSRDTGYSNFGSCLDIFAPGTGITSAWIGSNTSTNTISGTSMASPHVAGVAALYLQGNPGASASAVGSAITGSATTGVLSNVGSGSPNRLLYSPLTGGGGTTPPPTGSCASPVSGSLSGGQVANLASYTASSSGTHLGCLTGPGSADFDLYLQKLSGGSWVDVAAGETASSTENVTYSGTAGTYRWQVYAYAGSGTWTLSTARP